MKHPGSFKALTYLSLFGVAITVPLLLLSVALLLHSASVQRGQTEDRALQVLDALVNDLDRDLDRDITVLHTLATSQALAQADWPTFYNQAKAALQGRAYLVLADSSGRQLVNTYVPYGKQPAMTGDPETIRRILQTKAPVVSNLFTSLVVKGPVFNVSIPISQDGGIRYVMSLGLRPDDLLTLLRSQNLSSEWVTLLWDANGVILARSQQNPRYVGSRLPQSMREQSQRAVIRTTNLEGSDALHATGRSRISGWGVGVNIPYSMVTRDMRSTLLLWGAAAFLAVAIAILCGAFFARQISKSLSVAAGAAAAFGHGETFPLAGSRIEEVDAFLLVLRNAQQAQKKLNRELKQSEERFRTVSTELATTLETAATGLTHCSRDLRYLSANSAYAETAGVPLDRIVGRPVAEVMGEKAYEIKRPYIERVLSGERVEFEAELPWADGSSKWIHAIYTPEKDRNGIIIGWVASVTDISERVRAEESLREVLARAQKGESLLNAIMDHVPEGITYAESPDVTIRMVSRYGRALLGRPREMLEGIPVEEHARMWDLYRLDGTPARNEELPLTRAVKKGEVVLGEDWMIRDADGRKLVLLCNAAPVRDADGNIFGGLIAWRDITERKEAEEKLRVTNAALARANADLSQFAFAASHDLQEPLRMITAYSQLLLKRYRGQLEGEAALCLNNITEGTKRMGDLLSDLLSYTRVGENRPQTVSAIDLNRVFQGALANCGAGIDETGATVTSDPLPAVQGYEPHFLQLFQNLISNGLKYRAADRPPKIHVSAKKQDGLWCIAVKDNGMGIAPEYHKQIFGVFKRLHDRTIPGTGIGLAICQRVVERYGGTIWVESRENEGATFCFTLPPAAKGAAAHDG